jgi:ankyrin repeat protein
MSPLSEGGIPTMKYLIDRGVDINVTRRDWETPLHYAVFVGSKEKMQLLLDRGADLKIKNIRGMTPSEMAKERGEMDLFGILPT